MLPEQRPPRKLERLARRLWADETRVDLGADRFVSDVATGLTPTAMAHCRARRGRAQEPGQSPTGSSRASERSSEPVPDRAQAQSAFLDRAHPPRRCRFHSFCHPDSHGPRRLCRCIGCGLQGTTALRIGTTSHPRLPSPAATARITATHRTRSRSRGTSPGIPPLGSALLGQRSLSARAPGMAPHARCSQVVEVTAAGLGLDDVIDLGGSADADVGVAQLKPKAAFRR